MHERVPNGWGSVVWLPHPFECHCCVTLPRVTADCHHQDTRTMANLSETITGFTCGDPLTVARDVTDLPTGVTLTEAVLVVKRDLADSDAEAVVRLVIASTASDAGQITDPGTSDGRATLNFTLQPQHTTSLSQPHWFGIAVTRSDDQTTMTSRGVIRGHSRV